MNKANSRRAAVLAILSLVFAALFSVSAMAQSVKMEGLIKARNGDKMVIQTKESPDVSVLLTDDTRVAQSQGVFKARRKNMSMAALIPGLAVKIDATPDDNKQLVAKSVTFSGEDLKKAEAIQAGLHETQQETQKNQEEIAKQQAELKQQQAQLTEHQEKIAANKATIDAAMARFGQLDDYYILDQLTVYFGNGSVKVNSSYLPQLTALADKAKTINGYVIEIKGYASSVGSASLNQKLSEDRANNVTNILLQQCNVPLTRMLAPGAMGESQQVGNDRTAEGQAENRRVVVRVLQNKAVAGI
jgi:OmpA-OmpF porin, OOP family